jgi:hypothetical protein
LLTSESGRSYEIGRGHAAYYPGASDRRRRTRANPGADCRFLILPHVRVPHLASHILGLILRRLRADWQRKYAMAPCLAESFVDRERFARVCYRAANWILAGQSMWTQPCRSRSHHYRAAQGYVSLPAGGRFPPAALRMKKPIAARILRQWAREDPGSARAGHCRRSQQGQRPLDAQDLRGARRLLRPAFERRRTLPGPDADSRQTAAPIRRTRRATAPRASRPQR